MRKFKKTMEILIIVSFIIITYFSGMYSAEYKLKQENQKSTIATIAVVNADTGTMVNGEKKFYASELMGFPDTNFKSTGLEDAREGIVDGRYAAYILIPENFSASIESVNREPEKSQITYEIYDNLRQDVQTKVVNDVHNFILTLSTNISYIYVDAILEEMHAVQDDSEMIMQNDIADMEAIIGVETADLIAAVEYEPLEVTEIEIEYMDLTDDYERVNNTVEEIYNTYIANMQKAEEEFAAIKERSVGLGNLLTEVSDVFSSIDILVDDEDKNVYEEGMTELLGIVEKYEDGRNKKMEAKRSLGYKPDGEGEEEESDYISKDDLLEIVDTQIDVLKEIRTAAADGEDVEEKLTESISSHKDLKEQIKQYYSDAVAAVDNIPVVAELPDDVDRIIKEEIAISIMEEAQEEEEKIVSSASVLLSTVGEYVAELDKYDVDTYMEKEKIDENLSSLFHSIDEMEKEIMEQDVLYMEYVDDVTQIADNNVQMLQENIDTAYLQTQENVISAMESFKKNRADINELNVSLLDGITQKLPYTRLGNLEYTQVYDFIVEPVVTQDRSIVKNEAVEAVVDKDFIDLVCMFMGITALIILYFGVQLIHRKNRKLKK